MCLTVSSQVYFQTKSLADSERQGGDLSVVARKLLVINLLTTSLSRTLSHLAVVVIPLLSVSLSVVVRGWAGEHPT